MDYGLKLELSQKLVMTPQLRQAIAILQLSTQELAGMVEQELLENPVLEEDAPFQDTDTAVEETAASEPESITDYFDWAEYFNDGTDTGGVTRNEDKPSFEIFAAGESSLHDHLEFQLHLAVLENDAREIGAYLIGCIDDNGYFCGTTADAAQSLGVTEERVNQVLRVLQTFDPPGVGARDLKECLLIQVEQKGIHDRLVRLIIEHHLDDVAAGKFKIIAEKLNCTPHEVQKAVDVIRTLDPKPGMVFGRSGDLQYITPDVTVEKVNDEYVILVNDTNVPRLTINSFYRQVARDVDSDARKYLEGRLNAAVWLIKSIEQRRRTLYNVMEAILDMQREFFDYGPKYLKPLTMRKVAERVGVHESTVSRAIANKYVEVPHGLYGLRTFFSAAIQGMDGEDVAASRVKREMKELIQNESPSQPLSDQVLANMLTERGMAISRRTVTKYREELGIASSSKRRRY
ncbi:RNA polymerase factor sigma-54 [Lucifera butyrica]|nr:RNA polymerase factor sigma-54 [Lucifera butyrica]